LAEVLKLAKMVTGTKFRGGPVSWFLVFCVRENSSLSPHLPNQGEVLA
jgi:hypothetical protein